MHSTGGKGSARRPLSVDGKTFADNFDRIFRKKSDPSKHCQVYLKDGCSHIDGPICEFDSCDIRINAIETINTKDTKNV